MTSTRTLASSSVVIVGCGGLGVPAAWTCAAAGVGRLILCDDDAVEVSNLHRQVLYSESDAAASRAKVVALADALQRRFPHVELVPVARRLVGSDDLRALVAGADGLLEGSDDPCLKFAACDALLALRGAERPPVGVIAAAIGRRGQYFGQLATGACFRCLFEAPPPAAAVAGCRVAGILGPVALEVGAFAARSLIRLLKGQPDAVAGALMRLQSGRLDRVAVTVAADCPCRALEPRHSGVHPRP